MRKLLLILCVAMTMSAFAQSATTYRVKPLATIGDHCTQCLACVHFCPQQAMEIRHKPLPKEWQYHHPDIILKDMLQR